MNTILAKGASMTRRQWMWLWIWLLLFFIIFCVWNKLQNMNLKTTVPSTPVIVTPQHTETAINTDAVRKKDISLKIIKDGDTMKISGVFPSQEAVDKAIESLKSISSSVKKGTIIIDREAGNPKLLANITTLSKDLAKYKEGYIEYNENTLTIDGIVDSKQLKENLTTTASKISDTITVQNNTEVEEEVPEQTVSEKQPKTVVKDKEEKEKPLPQEPTKEVKATPKQIPLKTTAAAQKELNSLLKHKRVEFIYAKDILTKKSKKIINKVKEVLKKYPNIHVEIGGHTDSDGTLKNNQKLSERRAKAIKRYLVKHGISASRLTAVGYGETKPLVKNDSAVHKQVNRRVEFKVIK